MIKAILSIIAYKKIIESPIPYSFTIARYDDEQEIYLDIKNIDISVGVTKYTVKNIMAACSMSLYDYNETRKFLTYFLEKFLKKNKILESVLYLELDGKVIRIRNITIDNRRVLRIGISH